MVTARVYLHLPASQTRYRGERCTLIRNLSGQNNIAGKALVQVVVIFTGSFTILVMQSYWTNNVIITLCKAK